MLKLEKVYAASNGDVFLTKEVDYEKHTKEEIENLINQAIELYENGKAEKCEYKKGFKFGSYCDCDGNFLGNEQIHILTRYSDSQKGIYIKYNGKLDESFWDIVEEKLNKSYWDWDIVDIE